MKNFGLLFSILILTLIINNSIFSQTDFYIPLNIKDAYEKGTRSFDGKPGENYWQNSADYKINVKLEPNKDLISGSEKITYYNNSPDSLKYLVIRLYQNLNKPPSPKNYPMDPRSITEGVEIEKLFVNGDTVEVDGDNGANIRGTNMFIELDDPLAPGSTIQIECDWNFTVPGGWNPRMGKYDSTTFFIAYWYPQMSVYDDIDGWDTFQYNGEQEMYNDFSNFDVKISVPNNFGVWSTGMLQNPDEVLNEQYSSKYKEALTSDEIINIITVDDLEKEIYKTENDWNTWHFTAENITDVAFGTSDHYLWDATSYKPEDGERIYIAAAYKEESEDFYEVAELAKQTIKYFSTEMPAVTYPFPAMTVFNGSGGMEFPMIVNDGSTSSYRGTVGLTSHEIAHTYFPFYMGTNERKYAFMDEGWAVMLPFEFQDKLVEGYDPRVSNTARYERFAGMEEELPPMIPNTMVRGTTYRNIAYRRPGAAYQILKDALGTEMFLKGLHTFMERWNHKHPIPFDFFYSFNDATGMDLSWFWNPWFFERGYPDLSIKDVKYENDKVKVLVEKSGNIPVPVNLLILADDGSEKEIYETAMIWKNGDKELWFEIETDFNPVEVNLGNDKIPDVNNENNIFIFGTE